MELKRPKLDFNPHKPWILRFTNKDREVEACSQQLRRNVYFDQHNRVAQPPWLEEAGIVAGSFQVRQHTVGQMMVSGDLSNVDEELTTASTTINHAYMNLTI